MGAHDIQAPAQDNQVPPLEQVPMRDQVPVAPPPPLTDGDIRSSFVNLAQAMTSQDNATKSQFQAMTTQVNLEVGARVPHHSRTMAFRPRDFTRMNPPMFYGSKSYEKPSRFPK